MNEIVNKFLLTGGKVMSEMLLRQPEFILFIILWILYKKQRKNPKI